MSQEENQVLKKMSAVQVYWQLFKNIFILSSCTFGGGFVIIGMVKKTFVEKLHWISEEEMLDMTAIAQSAPDSWRKHCHCYRIQDPQSKRSINGSAGSSAAPSFYHICDFRFL